LTSARQPEPVPFETQRHPDGFRLRHNVVEVCIPIAERTVSRRIMPDPAAVADRRFKPGMGGDTPDDDPRYPASSAASLAAARAARTAGEAESWRRLDGAVVWYTLMLTAEEAEEHRGQAHVRSVTVDPRVRPRRAPRPSCGSVLPS
jgi:hypothetical protein